MNLLRFFRKHWKVFLPILSSAFFVSLFFFINRFYPIFPHTPPSNKPHLKFTESPIMTLIPFDLESKAPLRNPLEKRSLVFLPEPIDSSIPIIYIDVSGNKPKRYVFKNPPTTIFNVVPTVNCIFKLKNVGYEAASIVGVSIGSEFTKSTFLREEIYKKHVDLTGTIPDFVVKTILPHDSLDFLEPEIPLLFPEDSLSHQVIIHILLIYTDGNDNYYDTYSWFKYQMHNPEYYEAPEIHTERKGDRVNIYFTHIPSENLEVKDFLTFMESDFTPAYFLNEEETKILISNLPKRKH